MERQDIKKLWPSVGCSIRKDEVTFHGTGREAELIVAGLKVLAGQIAIRDAVSEEPVSAVDSRPYSDYKRDQGRGVPLKGEVDKLLQDIREPNFVPAPEAAAVS
ncbi:MAG TPA: hypothetical protein VN778_04250 [Verrucomicrobiae bacterium]|nr:hypothetical protein [Verrucomicrobiae bacterium]